MSLAQIFNQHHVKIGKFSSKSEEIDSNFKDRIRRSYQYSFHLGSNDLSPLWKMISDKNLALHQSLMSEHDDLGVLDDPGSGNLFYGFDNLFVDFTTSVLNDENARAAVAQAFMREIQLLSEAVGVKRTFNPEGGSLFPDRERPRDLEIDDMLSAIEDTIGHELFFPNPFPNEFGIPTKRGIISQRSIHAIYQAYCIKKLAEEYGGKILEIGAGLGRTAYFSRLFGVPDYTIVDIPLTNVAQAAFLGSVLPKDSIELTGETSDAALRIKDPSWLASNREEFDVFFNSDSLTEMTTSVMKSYLRRFNLTGSVFLSINHEANHDTVRNICSDICHQISRKPYWLRTGYIEELFIPTSTKEPC